jgi:glucokinase
MLERLTGYPVWLINDGSAFTLAEAILGAGRGAPTVVAFTLGTGIGGGIAINGKLHLGLGGTAGELGHQTVDPNGPLCVCGSRGCLEVFASGPAIAAMGARAVIQRLTTRIGELAGNDLDRITPETVMQAAEAGDMVARDILEQAGAYLGLGLANCANILCPDRVIIGGGASQLGEWLLAPAREMVKQHCRVVPAERIQILLSVLGNNAGIVGAAVWASQQPN